MTTFLAVLKNNWLRTVPRRVPTMVFIVITLGSMLFSVYITGTQEVKARVAFVTAQGVEAPQSTPALKVTAVDERPPRSSLVQQQYDAIVSVGADGAVNVETLRNAAFQQALSQLLTNPNADLSGYGEARGVGVNILGFMMMFLLMGSFANLFAFADDKEKGQLIRIAASPASFGGYLAAHCAYCLMMLLPEYLLLAALKLLGWNIGFSLGQYAGLMLALALLGVSFALLLNTLIHKPDNASMLGNSIMVLTSILSGGFYSFSRNNPTLDALVKVLPQKGMLDFATALQNGAAGAQWGSLAYVLALSAAMFTAACVILRKKYVRGA